MQNYQTNKLLVDFERRAVLCRESGQEIELTKTEWNLLRVLVINRGNGLPKEWLAQTLDERMTSNTAKWHIKNLRDKLGAALPITTLRGYGYRLETAK